MTDANGTHNNPDTRSGISSNGSNIPNRSNIGSASPSVSRYRSTFSPASTPTSATPKDSVAGSTSRLPVSKSSSFSSPNSKTSAAKAAAAKAPTSRSTASRRRSRSRSSNAANAGKEASGKGAGLERRRLFGAGPDRIKSKSSSRTRALKAKAAKSNTQTRALRKKSDGLSLGSAAKATLAEKERPTLPRAGYPGRVPPSRSLVRKKRRTLKTPKLVRVAIQLLIFGCGIAVIGATLFQPRDSAPEEAAEPTTEVTSQPTTKAFPVALNQEIAGIKSELQELPNIYPQLTPKVFYVDVDTGRYVNVEGGESVAAASTIKLPILLAFFEEVDAGRIDPTQTMAIQPPQVAEGSGDMQLSPPGTQFTALEVATQMIVNSDNTATNMMIDLLGGNEVLNSRFKLQGLEKTQLNNPLPDLEGTNTTSARDLVHTMLLISEGDELSVRSRDRVLNILKRTYNKSLLAEGLEPQGALTYNKTGDIAAMLGDVMLVDLPNGKRYATAVLVERPENDGRAVELIRRISGRTYQEADRVIQPAVTPLGDPDGNAPEGQSEPDGDQGATTVQPVEPELPEEEPYPSANP